MLKRVLNNFLITTKKTSQKGFTLIELLVVIGILGVLAAALVATIDPFEQLKKANDANIKNTAVEFVNATIRYYTTHNAMPWNNDPNCGTASQTGSNFSTAGQTLSTMTVCLADLVSDGELKPGFTTVTNILNSIIISGASNTTVACFNPQSKAENHDSNTKYNAVGVTQSGCPVTSGIATTCYWCAQ
ncbi:MAG TPA: type II secretion system protein [Patescibacteria group bacterium]